MFKEDWEQGVREGLFSEYLGVAVPSVAGSAFWGVLGTGDLQGAWPCGLLCISTWQMASTREQVVWHLRWRRRGPVAAGSRDLASSGRDSDAGSVQPAAGGNWRSRLSRLVKGKWFWAPNSAHSRAR